MPTLNDFEQLRKDYRLQSLLEKDVSEDALQQFRNWWQEVLDSKIEEPNAMTLATASPEGKPTARIVLLKEINEHGFVFFTNYESHKGKQIQSNPFGSLLFFWKELERQVRIEGGIEKVSPRESDAYYATRPMESRIGAWSSPQSQVLASRELLEENVEKFSRKFNSGNVPRPPHWGGYILRPVLIEFWQGRPGRLHDRLQYSLLGNGAWKIERLAP